MIVGDIARLPVDAGKECAEINGVLTRAAADLKRATSRGQPLGEPGGNRLAIAFAGGGEGPGHGVSFVPANCGAMK